MRKNVSDYFSLFLRKPRAGAQLHTFGSLGVRALAAIVAIAVTMVALDTLAIAQVLTLPHWLVAAFEWVTDFGKSPWFLYPLGFLLVLLAMLASPALSSMSRGVVAAIAVRLGFLFVAIALPGLLLTIVKRLIGRARPLVGGSIDPFLYRPLGWDVEYASLPSGHAVDAFAAAAAIGALWPKTRPWMWTYAVVIAASRVVLTAHFPSDVLAGAILAFAGVALVQAWFASRRLAFAFGQDGRILPLSRPSFSRLKRVARALIDP
jgi:undecaprenyl-diphosphatase